MALLFFHTLAADTYRLDNGMKVVLMPMEADDEVYFELSAKGGFAQLPPEEQAAGRISADVIWEAGLDGFSSEELSAKLYEASVEITPEVSPLFRRIEGSGWKGGLDTLLEISTLMFKDPKLNEEAVKKGLNRVAKKFRREEGLKDLHFETQSHLLNTQNWPPFKPLTHEALKEISWKNVASFYQKAFSSPEEFVLVIVGDFEMEETKKAVQKTLGAIPKKPSDFFKTPPKFPAFPQKPKMLKIVQKGRIDAFSRITFPVTLQLTPETRKELAFLCKVIEAALKKELRNERGAMHGIDVSYELPFFPYVSSAWVIIQFHANPGDIKKLSKTIENRLKSLKITPEAIQDVENEMENYESFWENMPSVKISQLSNVLLFGWSSKEAKTWDTPPQIGTEKLQKLKDELINFEEYTELILLP